MTLQRHDREGAGETVEHTAERERSPCGVLERLVRFRRQGDRPSARKLFLFTLLYLPLALGLLAIAWR